MRAIGTAMLLSALCVTGCTRMTRLTVVNDTHRDAIVSLEGPGEVDPSPSVPVASGGKALFTLQTPLAELPANYTWQGAKRKGTLVVTEKSPVERALHLSNGKESKATGDDDMD